jgi:predicted ester cyclase
MHHRLITALLLQARAAARVEPVGGVRRLQPPVPPKRVRLERARKERVVSQDVQVIKAAARRIVEELFPNADAAGLAEVMHPDMINHDGPPGAPLGLDSMTWSMRLLQAAFSDRRWEIHQVIAEGDTVVIDCTFRGRHTGEFMDLAPTNRAFALRQVHIVRFQDGKGIEHWALGDDLGLRRVLDAPLQPSQPVFADALAQQLSELHP